MKKDESMEIVTKLLLLRYGKDKIEGLLTGEWYIEKQRKLHTKYTRHLKDQKCVFCDCDDHYDLKAHTDKCIRPELLIDALDDACDAMSYSNWATDKFYRAAEIVFRYCEEHNIPMDLGRKDK